MERIMIMWISLLLSEMYPTDCEIVRQPNPVITASVGDNVLLLCSILEDHNDAVTWYKQTAGHQLQAVVMVQKFVTEPHFFNNFTSSRFSVETDSRKCHLKISNLRLSDEAMYYCGLKTYEIHFAGGTYLALQGSKNNHHEVSVVQHPESESVPSGAAVTLMCSVLSELKTDEIRMFWFRLDSENPVPEMLYTQTNQCESESTRSCTFNLSRKIRSQKDIGTYYCAVITCGTILFGNGTKMNMVKSADPLVIVLSVLLGVCVLVIIAQAILSHRKDSNQRLQNTEKVRPTSSQDRDAVELSYAALHIKDGKSRRVCRQVETLQDSLYSQISEPCGTDPRTAEY